MPQYGRFKYGKINKYGKYNLATKDGRAIGEHVRYRIANHPKEGSKTSYVSMHIDRVSIPATNQPMQIRMRANDGAWVRTQNETIPVDTHKVRIRSVSSNGDKGVWVNSERATLKKI